MSSLSLRITEALLGRIKAGESFSHMTNAFGFRFFSELKISHLGSTTRLATGIKTPYGKLLESMLYNPRETG